MLSALAWFAQFTQELEKVQKKICLDFSSKMTFICPTEILLWEGLPREQGRGNML